MKGHATHRVATPAHDEPDTQAPRPEELRAEAERQFDALVDQFVARGIATVPNRAEGIDGLTIALLQHAHGRYGPRDEVYFAELAEGIREDLRLQQGMPAPGSREIHGLVDHINLMYRNGQPHLNVILVSPRVNGDGGVVPQVRDLRSGRMGHDSVAVAQGPDHFEALVSARRIPRG